MAEKKDDVLGVLLQEVFSEPKGVRRVLEHLLGAAMAQEVEDHVAAAPHERTDERRGQRNGYKPRTLKTRVGICRCKCRR